MSLPDFVPDSLFIENARKAGWVRVVPDRLIESLRVDLVADIEAERIIGRSELPGIPQDAELYLYNVDGLAKNEFSFDYRRAAILGAGNSGDKGYQVFAFANEQTLEAYIGFFHGQRFYVRSWPIWSSKICDGYINVKSFGVYDALGSEGIMVKIASGQFDRSQFNFSHDQIEVVQILKFLENATINRVKVPGQPEPVLPQGIGITDLKDMVNLTGNNPIFKLINRSDDGDRLGGVQLGQAAHFNAGNADYEFYQIKGNNGYSFALWWKKDSETVFVRRTPIHFSSAHPQWINVRELKFTEAVAWLNEALNGDPVKANLFTFIDDDNPLRHPKKSYFKNENLFERLKS